MNSAKAFGWLIVGAINDHLWDFQEDWVTDEGDDGLLILDGVRTTVCPRCCGTCAALVEYFNTSRGRAEADVFVGALVKQGTGHDWQLPSGLIDWDKITQLIEGGVCSIHKKE